MRIQEQSKSRLQLSCKYFSFSKYFSKYFGKCFGKYFCKYGTLPLTIALISAPPTLLLQPSPVLAQETLVRTLTVTGEGSIAIPTTKTRIELGVEVQGATAITAQEEAAGRSTAIVDFLRSRQVEKLQTTGIRLDPIYRYQDGVQSLEGFTARNTVSFEVPTEEAGAIMDAAVRVGATQINDLRFMASETAIAQAQDQALAEATGDARRQAEVVLRSLGFSPQDIIQIQINGAAAPPPPAPVALRAAEFAADAASATPVVGAEQTVRASVTLQIRY